MTKQPSITIRPADHHDSDIVSDLCIQLGYQTTADLIRTRLHMIDGDANHRILVAVYNGRVAGMIHGMIKPMLIVDCYVEINALVVDSEHRGKGIGRMLIEHIEVWALDRGIGTVRLRSNVIRKEAHRFYDTVGYSIVKTQYAFNKELEP